VANRTRPVFIALPRLGKKRNFVKKLKYENGNWIEGWDDLFGHITGYFSNLFAYEVEAPNEEVINKVNHVFLRLRMVFVCSLDKRGG
jgi:hypothetical protein